MLKFNFVSKFLLIGGFALSLALGSCSEDKCKDKKCENGGACVEGKCNCVNGYTGDNCQVAPAKKMTLDVITLTEAPFKDSNGKTWDGPEDDPTSEADPDIQIRVLIDGQVMKGYSFKFWIDVNSLPQDFGDFDDKKLVFDNLKSNIVFDIRDADKDGDSFQSMGTVEFKVQGYITSKPSVINLKSADGKYAIVLKPVWE